MGSKRCVKCFVKETEAKGSKHVFIKRTEAKGLNMEEFYESNRNERSKYRKYVAPNLSLQGQKCDPKWLQNGALGHQNEAQMTPKWSLGGPKNRMRNTTPKKVVKKTFCTKIGGPILEPFLDKNRYRK